MIRYATTLLVLLILASPAATEPKVVFEDKFDDKPATSWKWLKENKKTWRLKDGALELRVMRGKDNIIAHELPDPKSGPFAIEVTLTSVPQPTRQYEQAGFGWYSGGKQRFKYVKELIDGKIYVFPGKKEMPAATVQLRIEVRGDKFTAHFRPEAKGEYIQAFAGNVPKSDDGKHHIALMCYNGPSDAEHWMRFDDFRILKLDNVK